MVLFDPDLVTLNALAEFVEDSRDEIETLSDLGLILHRELQLQTYWCSPTNGWTFASTCAAPGHAQVTITGAARL